MPSFTGLDQGFADWFFLLLFFLSFFFFLISEKINQTHPGCSPWRSEGSPVAVGAARHSRGKAGVTIAAQRRRNLETLNAVRKPSADPTAISNSHRSLSSASPDAPRNSWVNTVCSRGGLGRAGAGTEAAGSRGGSQKGALEW